MLEKVLCKIETNANIVNLLGNCFSIIVIVIVSKKTSLAWERFFEVFGSLEKGRILDFSGEFFISL